MSLARNINKSFSGLKVLCGVDLHIQKGEIYGLAGRSGAGKSTLLRCINGLEPYDDGELIVDGVNPKQLTNRDLRAFRKNIGMIFQNFSLLERLTVYDNVALPLRCWKHRASDVDRKVRELIGLVGLADKIRQKPRTLSGGQKQRVAIARALSLEPKILLCDEATSALDPKTSQEIIALLRRINHRMGITIVMVTHQMSVLSSACDQVAILENGRVEIKGPVKHIFRQQPLALRNLLGETHAAEQRDNPTITITIPGGDDLAGRLAAELGIELTVIGAKTGSGRHEQSGLMLRFTEDDFTDVRRYLENRKATWRILDDPIHPLRRAG